MSKDSRRQITVDSSDALLAFLIGQHFWGKARTPEVGRRETKILSAYMLRRGESVHSHLYKYEIEDETFTRSCTP